VTTQALEHVEIVGLIKSNIQLICCFNKERERERQEVNYIDIFCSI